MQNTSFNDPLSGITRRKLHVVLMLDCSRSMVGPRIASLNQSLLTVLPALQDASSRNPHAEVFVRQLEFSTGARWRGEWAAIDGYGKAWKYEPLSADGVTDLGAALDLVTTELDPEKLGAFNYPPVLVLVSDGQPTDDWESALRRFNEAPFGRKANRTVRAAINIDAEASELALTKFTGNPELVVNAHGAEQVATFLKWATVALSKHSSQARSVARNQAEPEAVSPPPPPASPDPADDVF